MKKTLSFFILFLVVTIAMSQNSKSKIANADIKDLEGKVINTSTFSNNEKPMIISFWATWCKPCVNELSAIAENYEAWQKETGVKLIAISIDDSRSMSRVAPFVNGKDWTYEVFCDPNGDFKRAMGVVNVPHTFLIDGKGNIVWQHTVFAEGDELKLYEIVKKVAAGEEIKE